MTAPISSTDLAALRSRLEAAGTFRKRTASTTAKLFVLLAGAAAGIIVPLLTVPWLFWPLLPVTALLFTAAVMIGHEGGHKSFSASGVANELLIYAIFPLIGGLSAQYWKHKHNVLHHTHPNIDGVDDDLELWPMAGSRRQYEASGPFRRFLQRNLQGWLFWPLSTFLTFSIRFSSISFLVRKARAGKRGAGFWADAGALAAHYALWLALPLALGVSFPIALAAYAALWGLIGLFLTAIFAPAHMGLPIFSAHDDTWRLQLETTRNLTMPGWLRFFFMGLEHQVEHHLFMKMPHQNMRRASPIVKAWAKERGLPYHEIGFAAALADVTRFVRDAWKHDSPAAKTRRAAEAEPAPALSVDRGALAVSLSCGS